MSTQRSGYRASWRRAKLPEVRAEGLRKTYGNVKALNDVSLVINDGEYLCIVGPSGCGKTSLIKSIAGINSPDAGEVTIDGKVVSPLPIEDRGVGYVFQEIALFPHMNVYDNVSYGLMVKGVATSERNEPVGEMLHMMNLEDFVSLHPDELSGGARQKTAISRALTSGSTLLLLDEPLGALDLKVRTILRYELRKLVKDLRLTAVHVTHDQEEALSISDRIVIMRAGRVVEVGSPRQLYLNPREIFTAKFLGEANFLTGKVLTRTKGGIHGDVGGAMFDAFAVGDACPLDGEACVLAIRPEFIEITDKPADHNSLACEVVNASFVGDSIRYDVRTENGLQLLVKAPSATVGAVFDSGDKVYVTLPRERLLTYRLPEEGLEKALSLE